MVFVKIQRSLKFEYRSESFLTEMDEGGYEGIKNKVQTRRGERERQFNELSPPLNTFYFRQPTRAGHVPLPSVCMSCSCPLNTLTNYFSPKDKNGADTSAYTTTSKLCRANCVFLIGRKSWAYYTIYNSSIAHLSWPFWNQP